MWRLLSLALILILTSACGGGGGGDSGGSGSGSSGSGGNGLGNGGTDPAETWHEGLFQPSLRFANRCAAPRSGVDPYTHTPYPDLSGTFVDENNWLRSWTHELYLWYREVPDLNPALYTTPQYFELMKTREITSSGRPKDPPEFHFTYPTAEWEALLEGSEVSYGVTWAILSPTRPRDVRVAYVEPLAPATTVSAGLARGTPVLAVDGFDIDDNTDEGVAALNAGLFPATAGESHTFRVRDLHGAERDVTLVAANVESTPVQNVRTVDSEVGKVGYMLFNDHLPTAEGALIDAIEQLRAAGVSELVLDIRYNGGGLLDIASELAYMIAGPTATAGQTFELQQFNDQYPTTNPVTGLPITPVPFHSTTQGFQPGLDPGEPLPTLELSRLVVLTGSNTCSASESIINSLLGIHVPVIQIGSPTCGKPYGFYPQDNCGTTYFSIEFRGVNAEGFGDYADGFAPADSAGPVSPPLVRGCSVSDDFHHELGDPAEARFAAALNYLATSSCTGAATSAVKPLAAPAGRDVIVPKSPWRENRILRP